MFSTVFGVSGDGEAQVVTASGSSMETKRAHDFQVQNGALGFW